ncbi:MAG TPA: peptidoglycan editing factor PgeF [Pyrinomonadaceae bacterium]|nr:peptidoglycan editing factor PgeF [Pyrinomonadaceae bacterium]
METITEELGLGRAGFLWRGGEAGVRALVCGPLEAEGFANAFSTRAGGVSPFPSGSLNLAGFDEDARQNILENRRRFFGVLGGRWEFSGCWQVHGAEVRVVRGRPDARSESDRCDALATREPGILLGVKTADCVPVLLGDARTGACAAVHAGWRGTLQEIVGRALSKMREEFGTRAEDVRAALGPAALACCYEVGSEVVEAFRAKFADADSLFTPTRAGHARVDLHRANLEQLVAAGVPARRIHAAPLCTICRPDLFFSYRRDKKLHGRTGRHLSVIGKKVSSYEFRVSSSGGAS